MSYCPELKEAMFRRSLPSNIDFISIKIAKKEGISGQTLCNWLDRAKQEEYATPGKDAIPDNWSTHD